MLHKVADQGRLLGKDKDFCLQEKDYKEKMVELQS